MPGTRASAAMVLTIYWSWKIPASTPEGVTCTLKPGQNGQHFPDVIFQCISLNENVWISIKISLKFVPKGPINNISTLVQIMAWRRQGIIWASPCGPRVRESSMSVSVGNGKHQWGEWFFYAFSYQIQMQLRCNWRGSFRDKDDWKLF